MKRALRKYNRELAKDRFDSDLLSKQFDEEVPPIEHEIFVLQQEINKEACN